MNRSRVALNVLIVLALAAAVAFVPGGWPVGTFFGNLLSIVLFTGLVWFAARLYMEHRVVLFGIGDRNRAILYGSVAVIVLTLTASRELFDTGPGTLAWFMLITAAIFGLVYVFRAWRSYE